MLKSPLLFSISFLVTLLSWTSTVKAEDAGLALSFALPPVGEAVATPSKRLAESNSLVNSGELALAVESDRAIDALSRPQESLRAISDGSTMEATSEATSIKATSVSDIVASDRAAYEPEKEQASGNPDNSSSINNSGNADDKAVGIHFLKDDLQLPEKASDESPAELPNQVPLDELEQTAQNRYSQLIEGSHIEENYVAETYLEKTDSADGNEASELDDWIFDGGSRSLVAHTVGSAEGTRHWNGDRTKAYHGHVDPGNGVWNLGTFSYQHGASSPEEADDKQLRRLKSQGIQLEQQASQKGIQLSLQEKLNGLDLANQAPIAALGKGGYIDRLEQAYRLQLSGEDAIAWARTRAYIDPDTKQWNAPGLGNNLYSISKDQERRMAAIDKALRAYNQVNHDNLELAKLERIKLENPGLKGVGLGRRTAAKTSFDGVAEEFKLAAHNISLAEIGNRAEPEATLTATAISFDLPNVTTTSTVAENISALQATLPDSAQIASAPATTHETAVNETSDISLTFASDHITPNGLVPGNIIEEVTTEVPIANQKADAFEITSSEPITFEPAETVLAEEIAAERLASTKPASEALNTEDHIAQNQTVEGQTSEEQISKGDQIPTLTSLLNGTSSPESEDAPTLSSLSEPSPSESSPSEPSPESSPSESSHKSPLSDSNTDAKAAPSLLRIEDKILHPPTSSR